MTTIKLIATSPYAQAPQRQNSGDVCADLFATESMQLDSTRPNFVDFGIVVHPDSYKQLMALKLYIRSSLAAKRGCSLANGVGVIEPEFAGFTADGKLHGITGLLNGCLALSRGMRVCQLEAIDAEGRLFKPDYEIVSWLQLDEHEQWLEGRRSGIGST